MLDFFPAQRRFVLGGSTHAEMDAGPVANGPVHNAPLASARIWASLCPCATQSARLVRLRVAISLVLIGSVPRCWMIRAPQYRQAGLNSRCCGLVWALVQSGHGVTVPAR